MERTATTPKFARGMLLPPASLLSIRDGQSVSLRDARGPLVLFVVHSPDCAGCVEYVRRLAAEAASSTEWGAAVMVVVRGAASGATIHEPAAGLRVLQDVEGTIEARLDPAAAAVLIADEWGEIYFAAEAGPEHELPDAVEIAEWVRFIAIQCPECEQPEGEWRNV